MKLTNRNMWAEFGRLHYSCTGYSAIEVDWKNRTDSIAACSTWLDFSLKKEALVELRVLRQFALGVKEHALAKAVVELEKHLYYCETRPLIAKKIRQFSDEHRARLSAAKGTYEAKKEAEEPRVNLSDTGLPSKT